MASSISFPESCINAGQSAVVSDSKIRNVIEVGEITTQFSTKRVLSL